MPALTPRPQKITFAEMRAAGVRGLPVYCSDYRCSYSTTLGGDRWPDNVRLSDIEPRFKCQASDFNWELESRQAPEILANDPPSMSWPAER
jgi:hypothetical protein